VQGIEGQRWLDGGGCGALVGSFALSENRGEGQNGRREMLGRR
jgi:hypothetical protein